MSDIRVHNEGEPLIIERHYKGSVDGHEFWFITDGENTKLEWFFRKTVPPNVKKREEEIIDYFFQTIL